MHSVLLQHHHTELEGVPPGIVEVQPLPPGNLENSPSAPPTPLPSLLLPLLLLCGERGWVWTMGDPSQSREGIEK